MAGSTQDQVPGPSVTTLVTQPQPLPGILHSHPGTSSDTPSQGDDMLDDPSHRWVKNLSKIPLTPAQRSLLSKGLNYAIAPRHPSNLEYITSIESACQKLNQQDAEELRADIRGF